ncbi:MAG: cation:dicarboxylase symporter family transporter [Spirochaetales bacterium]|uniref:cation:dicarboxylate symporter family transporter n=1 Tax=Bullifex sp. TaxID=2815808 RepID=UPI002A58188F|nr:cation:dicarboxylase symporter family transporter [Bullifex sp.]MDD5973733.1 cation:dicarboxylase symporter family transporter [Spirochaetales bacterium]MDD7270454.1 cation:dicarboxylase symporter family transporter [Spirochaetales bacterium]MDY4068199.1 cation:dicarboxylase symporter family transporter [Bullifex sp.]
MKTWITYLAALFMGLATTLLFGDSVYIMSILLTLSEIAVNIGFLLFIPLVLVGFSSGVSSLKKDNLGGKNLAGIIIWSCLTALVLPLCAGLLFTLYPVNFPVSSTAGYESFSDSLITSIFSSAGKELLTGNAFYTLATASSFVLPIILISWILGYALKPNADVIKPAYTVVNSFSEVMFRLSRAYSALSYIIVYISSAHIFTSLYQEKTIFVAPKFVILFITITILTSLIIIPLLYAIITKGKRNPYKDTFRSISAMIMGFTTSNILVTAPVIEATSRHNNGVQKRTASTATPLFILIGKGGTAVITTLSVLAILTSVTGSKIDINTTIIVALVSAIASFASSLAPGFEVMFTSILVFKLTNVSLYGAEMTIMGLLPFVNGLAVMLDAQIAMLGNVVAARFIKTDIKPPYKDIL